MLLGSILKLKFILKDIKFFFFFGNVIKGTLETDNIHWPVDLILTSEF